MSSIDLPLPDDLKAFVEAEAAASGYTSPADYVLDVLRTLWKQKAHFDLESKVLEAIDSGPAIEITPQFWEDLKARVRSRHRSARAS